MTRRTGFPDAVKAIVYERATDVDGVMRCEKCGKDYGDVEVHHRLPRGRGGSRRLEINEAANALALDMIVPLVDRVIPHGSVRERVAAEVPVALQRKQAGQVIESETKKAPATALTAPERGRTYVRGTTC